MCLLQWIERKTSFEVTLVVHDISHEFVEIVETMKGTVRAPQYTSNEDDTKQIYGSTELEIIRSYKKDNGVCWFKEVELKHLWYMLLQEAESPPFLIKISDYAMNLSHCTLLCVTKTVAQHMLPLIK